MLLKELATAFDGNTERVTSLATMDAFGNGMNDSVPGVGRNNGVNTTVGQNMHPTFEERNEDEDAGFVASVMEAMLNKGNNRLLLNFFADFNGVDEASSERGQAANKYLEREVTKGKKPQKMPE
jgi:hypothetical protein